MNRSENDRHDVAAPLAIDDNHLVRFAPITAQLLGAAHHRIMSAAGTLRPFAALHQYFRSLSKLAAHLAKGQVN